MHELSVCQSLLKQVTNIASQHHASSVKQITLHIGPLSGVEPQLLLQAFPAASAGTVAQNATLVVESLPIRVRCNSCHKDSDALVNKLVCGHCGDYHTRVISGDELLLANLELTKEQ